MYSSVLNCSVISTVITISLSHNTYDVYKIQLNFNMIKYIKSPLILVFVIPFSLVNKQKTLYTCNSHLQSIEHNDFFSFGLFLDLIKV